MPEPIKVPETKKRIQITYTPEQKKKMQEHCAQFVTALNCPAPTEHSDLDYE